MNSSRRKNQAVLDNPFFHRGPVRDQSYFFGRGGETRRALQMLRRNQCVSIVGPRRIGKTSLLYHLRDPQVQQEHGLGEDCLFVYIDCQGLGDLDKRQFYRWLWQETNRTLGEWKEVDAVVHKDDGSWQEPERESLTRLRRILETRFDEDGLRTLCFDLGKAYDSLAGASQNGKARELLAYLERHERIPDLIKTGKRLRSDIPWDEPLQARRETLDVTTFSGFRDAMMSVGHRGHKPILLFDEFDTVALNPNLDQDLFSDLRSLVPSVVYVTASYDSLFDLTFADAGVLSSPFFNVFKDIRLGFLNPRDAREMVLDLSSMAGQRGRFNEDDLAFVFEMGGHHPFFLQLACYALFEKKIERQKLETPDYQGARRDFDEEAEAHFRYVWKRLDEDEQEAVYLTSRGKVKQLDNKQRRRLKRKSILYNDTIFSSSFSEFVRQQMGATIETTVHKETTTDALEESTDEIITRIDQMGQSIKEIKGALERLPFAGVETLGNFEGFVLVEITDAEGNLIGSFKEQGYVLTRDHVYQLRVTIQSQEPSKGVFETLRLTGGQDVDCVGLVVKLDCDSLDFEPDQLEFTARAKQTETIVQTARAKVVGGIHSLFMLIYQRNTLVRRMRLELDVR